MTFLPLPALAGRNRFCRAFLVSAVLAALIAGCTPFSSTADRSASALQRAMGKDGRASAKAARLSRKSEQARVKALADDKSFPTAAEAGLK